MTKIVMISDTHEQHSQLVIPECDLLIHAGDITGRGAMSKLEAFNTWIADLIADGVVGDAVYIAGNHDITLGGAEKGDVERYEGVLKAGQYLNNSMAYVHNAEEEEPLCIWGIPEQLAFCDWAFNTDEEGLAQRFAAIPEGVDVLVTHGPPKGVLDANTGGIACGSLALLDWIQKYEPRLVVCGHIHEGHGIAMVGNTLVVNAASCTYDYKPTNQPIVLEL